MDTIQKDFERKINRRIRRNNNRKKKEHEKNPERIMRGKEIMRKIIEQEENVEFRIQARVELIDMANLAIGLERAGENKYLRSLTLLTQAAFKLAVDSLMDRVDQIEDVDEAVEILERMRIIDIESSSLSGGALKRNRTRTALREFHGDRRETRSKIGRRELTQEEVDKEVLRSPAVQAFLREKKQREIEEQREIERTEQQPKVTPEQLAYMNEYAMRMDLPGLIPNPTRKEPDFVLNETQEEKMERFRKASEEKLDEQYPQGE